MMENNLDNSETQPFLIATIFWHQFCVLYDIVIEYIFILLTVPSIDMAMEYRSIFSLSLPFVGLWSVIQFR